MTLIRTALMLAVAGGLATAQTLTTEDRLRLSELERRVAILSQELEGRKQAATSETSGTRPGLGAAASKVYAVPDGLSIGGYGELLYQARENRLQDGTTGVGEKNLDALRLVFYVGYKFTDRIVFNSEVEFEHGGYSDEHPEGEAIVEFAYVDFLVNRGLNVRVGQMIIPMGFINEGHEPPAFLGARRPLVERLILPTTWHENGVGLHGDLAGNLTYRLYLVNGLRADRFTAEGIRDGRQAGKEANAQSLAWTGRLDWTPVPGALLGASFFTGNSNQLGGERLTTTVADLHGEWRHAGWQIRGLYARTTLSGGYLQGLGASDPAREVGTRQWGGYLEAGYDVLGGRQSLVPFLRMERLNTQAEVVSGVTPQGAHDQTVLTMGAQWKPLPQVALKIDWQKVENRARTGQNQANVALGFFF